MSAPASIPSAEERLLTFEVAGVFYAIPIAGVLEVAEISRVACIPTLPTCVGGVINYHGDALPVLRRSSLFEVDESTLCEPSNVLVIAGRIGDGARLGVPVDRVLGLVEGVAASVSGTKAVAERRSIQGRVASVLDSQRLVSRARDVIESSLGRSV